MPNEPIDNLKIQVQTDSASAVKGLDSLAASLTKLKQATQGGLGMTSVINNLKKLNDATKTLNNSNITVLSKLGTALSGLGKLGNIKLSSSIANQLNRIGTALHSIQDADVNRLTRLTASLNQLGNVNLGNVSGQINNVSRSVSRMNQNTQGAQATNAATKSGNKLTGVFSSLKDNAMNVYASLKIAYAGVQRISDMVGGFIAKSTQYVEDLNLFNASLGKYAEEAQKYAENVGEVLGIDPGQWMRNQGIFNTILTGFGVVEDRAYLMSQQLTQLGYDISSFFNLSYDESMAKLESGIAGELEPLRRIGYDLSVARLQQEAYALGITKSVSAMNQAEKAELRYHAIMTQVIDSHGDMARTLNAPANQLRILQAQLDMAAREIGNIFIPALNLILPYAIAAIKAIRALAKEVANFFGFELPEVDYSSLEAMKNATANAVDLGDVESGIADTAADIADSAGDLGDGLGDAVKQAKKLKTQMIGIDELNIISKPDDITSAISGGSSGSGKKPSSGGSGGSGGLNDGSVGGGGLGIELPTYDFLGDAIIKNIDDTTKEIREKIQGALEKFGEIITIAGLASIGLGVLLVLTGNILLGLGMIVAGSALLAATAVNWNDGASTKNKLIEYLGKFAIFTGIALVGLGILLTATGNVPLGLGLVLGGVAALGFGVAALKTTDNDTFNKLKSFLTTFTTISGLALVGLGMLLLMLPGHKLVGLAMLVSGVGLLATAVTLNSSDKGLMGNITNFLASFTAISGLAMMGLGMIMLLVSGANLMALGLIVGGMVAYSVGTVAMSDGVDLKNNLKGFLASLLSFTGATAVVMGTIMLFLGQLPIGLGLIALGAGSILASGALDPKSLADKLNTAIVKTNNLMKPLTFTYDIATNLGLIPKDLRTHLDKLEKSDDSKVRLGAGLMKGADSAVKGDIVGMVQSLPQIFANIFTKVDEKKEGKKTKESLNNIANNLGVTNAVIGVTMDTVTEKAKMSDFAWLVKKHAEQKAKIEYQAIMASDAAEQLTNEILLDLAKLPENSTILQYKAEVVGGVQNLNALMRKAQLEVDKTPVQIGMEFQASAIDRLRAKWGDEAPKIAKEQPLELLASMAYDYNNTIYKGSDTFVKKVLDNLQKYYDNEELLAKLGIDKQLLASDAETQYKFLEKVFQTEGNTGLKAKIGADVTEADRKAKGLFNTLTQFYDKNYITAILDSNTMSAEEKEKKLRELLYKATGGKYTYKLTADGNPAIDTNSKTFNTMSEFARKNPITGRVQMGTVEGKTVKDVRNNGQTYLNNPKNFLTYFGQHGWANGQTIANRVTSSRNTLANGRNNLTFYGVHGWANGQSVGNRVTNTRNTLSNGRNNLTFYGVHGWANGQSVGNRVTSARNTLSNGKNNLTFYGQHGWSNGQSIADRVTGTRSTLKNGKNNLTFYGVHSWYTGQTLAERVTSSRNTLSNGKNNLTFYGKHGWATGQGVGDRVANTRNTLSNGKNYLTFYGKNAWAAGQGLSDRISNSKAYLANQKRWMPAYLKAKMASGYTAADTWNNTTAKLPNWLRDGFLRAKMAPGNTAYNAWDASTAHLGEWGRNGYLYAVLGNNVWNVWNNATKNLKADAVIEATVKAANQVTLSAMAMMGMRVPLMAAGGFPEEGQMFIAREAGPELVGSIGGKTAVANNDQIVAAVAAGVYDAVLAAMKSSGDGKQDIVINLDGEVIYKNQQKIASRKGYNFNQGAFA